MYFQHVIKPCSHAVCLEDRVLLIPQSPRASSQLFLHLLNSKQVILSSEKEATEWVFFFYLTLPYSVGYEVTM